MTKLATKIAVITGVTSGIGAALVERMLAAGAHVIGIARAADRLAEMHARYAARDLRFEPVIADLADPEQRARAFADLAARATRVDILVNNAAACVYETPTGLADAEWRALWETNVLSATELVRALHAAIPRGGHVVNVSSVTTRFLPHVRYAPYAMTKSAVDQLTDALRLELQPRGIKVSLVSPGLVDTPIYDKVEGFEKMRAKLTELVPTWLSADDVASSIEWLLALPEHVVVGHLTLYPQDQPR